MGDDPGDEEVLTNAGVLAVEDCAILLVLEN